LELVHLRPEIPNDLYCVEWDVKPYSTQLNPEIPKVSQRETAKTALFAKPVSEMV